MTLASDGDENLLALEFLTLTSDGDENPLGFELLTLTSDGGENSLLFEWLLISLLLDGDVCRAIWMFSNFPRIGEVFWLTCKFSRLATSLSDGDPLLCVSLG